MTLHPGTGYVAIGPTVPLKFSKRSVSTDVITGSGSVLMFEAIACGAVMTKINAAQINAVSSLDR